MHSVLLKRKYFQFRLEMSNKGLVKGLQHLLQHPGSILLNSTDQVETVCYLLLAVLKHVESMLNEFKSV